MTFGPYAFAPVGRNAPVDPARDIALGRGYRYSDLHDPDRLRDLDADFRRVLAASDPALSGRFEAYRGGAELQPPEDGDLLIAVARHLSRFVAELFPITPELEALRAATLSDHPVLGLREFVSRRAIKKYVAGSLTAEEATALDARLDQLLPVMDAGAGDRELRIGRAVSALLQLETALLATPVPADAVPSAQQLAARVAALPEPPAAPIEGATAPELTFVRALLDLFERWAAVHHHEPAAHRRVASWVAFRLPHKLDHSALVPLRRPRAELARDDGRPTTSTGAGRDGFGLTDPRMSRRGGAGRGRLLPLLPRAAQGLLLARPAREGRHRQAQPAGHYAQRLPAATSGSARCTSCARRATRWARWRWSPSTTRCCRGPATGSATTA